jgi:hypothetical protein
MVRIEIIRLYRYCSNPQFFLVFSFGHYIRADLLYNCNFDNATLDDHCFTTRILVFSGFQFFSEQPPGSPLSDVTSSRENKYYR